MSLKNALLVLSLVVVGGFSVVAEAGGCRRVCPRVCQPVCQPRPVCNTNVTAQGYTYEWRVTGRTYDARTGITWTHYKGYPVANSNAGYNNSYDNSNANTAGNDAQTAPTYGNNRGSSQTDILQSAPRRQNVNDPDSDLDFYAFPRR